MGKITSSSFKSAKSSAESSIVTVRGAILEAAKRISARDAELLVGHVLGSDRAWIIAHKEDLLSEDEFQRFICLAARRAAGEPMQYIIGTQEFFGLSLHVEQGVLIPRPETEHLVEAVLQWCSNRKDDKLRIVDVGTGSGAIALALAKNVPESEITATDLSDTALGIASSNAVQLGFADRILFLRADLLEPFASNSFDVVVSNPPYIPLGDAAQMQKEVAEHEPRDALFAGLDGLDVYRRLIPKAKVILRAGGLLAMEFGFGQQQALKQLLQGWDRVRFLKDYAGIARVVLAERME